MLLNEIYNGSREVLCIYSGRFQPFHKGHAHVFKTVQDMFGNDNCFIATSAVQDIVKSPFSFDEKVQMITATGIDKSRVVQVKSPYSAKEIYNHYDPENTVLIYVVGKEVGRLGTDSYSELPEDLNDAKPMSEQKYQVNVPTYEFTVLGRPITSATEIRAMYKKLDDKEAVMFVHDLFGEVNNNIQKILDTKLSRERNSIHECIQRLDEIVVMYNPGDYKPRTSGNKSKHDDSPKRRDTRWGNKIFPGNKGVLARAYFKLNELIKTLNDLDPSKENDPESMKEVLTKLRTVKELIQKYKGKQSEVQ